jgi:monoamine oxidase
VEGTDPVVRPARPAIDPVDLAVIGAGAAGTWIAHRMQGAWPDRSIALFERTQRIGGRLRSVKAPGIEHPIELGGMRFLTTHRTVRSVVEELRLATRPFDTRRGPERTVLRGRLGAGPLDRAAGDAYELPIGERGRSAIDLTREAFLRLVPDAESLDEAGWRRTRATHRYLDRPLTDWTIAEAVGTVRSPEAQRFVTDAFGYDSGFRPFNAADAVQYILGGGDPTAEARVPVDGMDRIPSGLAERFSAAGGTLALEHQLEQLVVEDGLVRLRFTEGRSAVARTAVLTGSIASLQALAESSSIMSTPTWQRLLGAVEGFPATKLYLWFDRPWWRDGPGGIAGIRSTTDLPNRKVFYFDDRADAPAAVLAAYTDGRDTAPWIELADGTSDGAPAPERMLAAALAYLGRVHPSVSRIPRPTGSAFMHWGSDPHDVGWTFWSAGVNSDDMMDLALQPDPAVPLFVAGEAFSRSQAWVEGALASAQSVVDRLLDGGRRGA